MGRRASGARPATTAKLAQRVEAPRSPLRPDATRSRPPGAPQSISQHPLHLRHQILDLRSLAPFDWSAIRTSVEKTNRVIIAHEDCLSFGYAAEIAARIADELFDRLDAPVRRVAALDTWVAYQPQVENAILPQVEDLVAEMERVLAY